MFPSRDSDIEVEKSQNSEKKSFYVRIPKSQRMILAYSFLGCCENISELGYEMDSELFLGFGVNGIKLLLELRNLIIFRTLRVLGYIWLEKIRCCSTVDKVAANNPIRSECVHAQPCKTKSRLTLGGLITLLTVCTSQQPEAEIQSWKGSVAQRENSGTEKKKSVSAPLQEIGSG
ncbi:hypothetical protein ZIOFF_019073 [Zingiber officinale]|uniref:Uncharacterized protein n=1 Tax=Zingiber officinale TaxID=94328 RepID=A0A8J5LMM0_ZINOF|nr:hypothetical protein ZIOFF_019073 [Zingiber officinale]